MEDIENGPNGGGQPGRARKGWLASLRSGARPAIDDGHAATDANVFHAPFKRFSAVPEEKSTASRPDGAGSSQLDAAGSNASALAAPSSSSLATGSGSLSRAAPAYQTLQHSSYESAASAAAQRTTRREQQQLTGAGSSGGEASSMGPGSMVSAASAGSSGLRHPLPSAAPTARALGDVVIGRPSTQVKVSEDQVKKYMHMAPEEEREEQVTRSKQLWGRGVIHPLDRRYRLWWYVTVVAACITGWVVPFRLAYMDIVGYESAHLEGSLVLELVLVLIFCIDILVSFFVGFFDSNGLLVMGHKAVAINYLRHRFVWDVITTVPWDFIALAASPSSCLGLSHSAAERRDRFVGLLGLLKLGRMYRVVVMYNNMSYNLNFGLLALTLVRNSTFSFYLLHWAACTFWYIALQEGQGPRTWVAQEQEMLSGSSIIELYIFSFYWALVTFATLGYGDVTPGTTAEVLFTIVYVAVNIVVWAYILGTITLLVTKQDEETGNYRSRMAALNSYCTANSVPADLKHTMAGLLRLHMSLQNETLGDEQVLAVYPTTIRRRILRQLYSHPLKECYLFQKCGVKFLDALMLGARVELFLPKVEIVSALDHVNELYVVVAGHVEVIAPAALKDGINNVDNNNNDNGDAPSSPKAPYRSGDGGGGGGWVSTRGPSHPAAVGNVANPRTSPAPLASLPSTASDHPNSFNSTQSAPTPTAGSRSGSFVARLLPRSLTRWVSGAHTDSWRRQQEQLQQDKAALARASVYGALSRASRVMGAAGVANGGAVAAAGGAAARSLDKLSKLPMHVMAHVMSDVAPPASGGPQGVEQEGDMTSDNPVLGPSDCFAEVAYFTEVPKAEGVRSLTVCRVLVIPRSTYNAVARDFPLSARQVLQNLKDRAAEMVAQFLPEDIARQLLQQADHLSPLAPAEGEAGQFDDLDMPYLHLPAQHSQRYNTDSTGGGTGGGTAPGQEEQEQAAAAAAPVPDSPVAATAAVVRPPKDRPLLSSMSVQLSSRYATPSLASSSVTSHMSADDAAAAAATAAGEGSRQAKALHRFTSLPRPKVMSSISADAAEAAAAAAFAARSAADGAAAAWEGRDGLEPSPGFGSSSGGGGGGRSLGGRGGVGAARGSGGQRLLTTMSLLPYGRREDVARALEGMRHDPQQQQQQQRGRQRFSIDLSKGSGGWGQQHQLTQQQQPAGDAAAAAAAKAFGSSGGGAAGVGSGGGGGGADVRTFSDEQVQAAAVATGRLTLQQQRLLADLLRLRQLVNKAAAKFDQQRSTAFLDAAASGEVDVVQDMLRQGMSPNSADYDGRTALMLAAYKGHKDVVLALLFQGAAMSPKDARGFDVMIEAARGGNREILDVLTRKGGRAGISRVLQASLLCKATYEGKLDRLSNLIRAGCVVDAADYDGQTALHVAAADGNLPAARVLLAAGADTTLRDRWGYSPLDLAHKVGAAPLLDLFREAAPPAALAAAGEAWRRERTEAALAAARYGDTASLERLLARGCPVDASDYDGRTLLHVAVTNKQEAMVRLLLAAGANPNATDSAGRSPLLDAAMNGSSRVQADLMAGGARLGLPSTEEAALLSSVLHSRRHDQLLALLKAGADPAAADYDSRTPLHIAASMGDVEALRLLAAAVADSSIERLTGVNWAARDRWGDTPLQEALRAGHSAAAAFLRDIEQQQQQQQHPVRSSSLPPPPAAPATLGSLSSTLSPQLSSSAPVSSINTQQLQHSLGHSLCGHGQQQQQEQEQQQQQQQEWGQQAQEPQP